MQIVFNPIGVVSNKAGEGAVRDAGKDSAAEIEIYPEFEDALEGIEGFSHLFVRAGRSSQGEAAAHAEEGLHPR